MMRSICFGILLALATGFFVRGCRDRLRLMLAGRSEARRDRLWERLRGVVVYAFGQRRVLRRKFGRNHFIIFWAFMVLLLANGEFVASGLNPAWSLDFLPQALLCPLRFLFDAVSLLALLAVGVAALRRIFFPPDYLASRYVGARSGEAFLILGFIALLMLAYFILNGARIALGSMHNASWMPISRMAGHFLGGLSPRTLHGVAECAWWLHAVVLLAFMNVLPRSKHMHILTVIPNIFFRKLEQPDLPPREDFSSGTAFGVADSKDFTWKDLLDTFSCAECGRCQEVCPAFQTGKPLSPRDIVHNIKIHLLAGGKLGPLVGAFGEGHCSGEELWSCTACGACQNICPALVEHPGKILRMRRFLVEMQAHFPEELYGFFENMEQRGNPWGIMPAERDRWAAAQTVREFVPGKTEWLVYVGCAGAFDTRCQQVLRALCRVLDAAGLDWGTLGNAELCCGESLRRLGNEYMFEKMAQENVRCLQEHGVGKVMTVCPHCFSTLKNDYRAYGADFEVWHHSQVLAHLAQSGRLRLAPADLWGKVLYHDPCTLGRHNREFAAPRAVVAASCGQMPLEFPRHGEEGFCCGAGGGRMWMEESTGERINRTRLREGLALAPDTLCTACPYCLIMLEDAAKDEGLELKVRDIAEITARALQEAG